MKRKALKLSFDYIDTPERRVLSLVADGVACVPVLGFDAYRRQWRAAPIHVHDECLEISFCLRGDLAFELGECHQDVKHHASRGRAGVDLLGDADEAGVVRLEKRLQLGKIDQRAT